MCLYCPFLPLINFFLCPTYFLVIEAREVVDVQNIEHIAYDKKPIGDELTKIEENWAAQRDMLYRQIGFNQHGGEKQQQQQLQLVQHRLEEEPDEGEDEDFEQELEQLLSRP